MKTTVLALAAAIAAGTTAIAQDAVQWRVEDGGNGRWYQLVSTPRSWGGSLEYAVSIGASLATADSETKSEFLKGVMSAAGHSRAWLGGFQDPEAKDFSEPAGGWRWIDGSPWDFTQWSWGEPNNLGGEDHLELWPSGWNDLPSFIELASLVEWTADCNGDGIVDYGQILDGTLIDKNGNGIPDCCEFNLPCLPEPCPGDLNNDGVVNGADIAVLLGFWGLNGKPVDADITGDGLVDGADLAMLLSSWGACP